MLLSSACRQSLLLVAILAAAGCGSKKGGRDGADVLRVSHGIPIDYKIADPACQKTRGDRDIGPTDIRFWTGENAEFENYEIEGLDGRNGTTSPLILETVYGLHIRSLKKCDVNQSGEAVNCSEPQETQVAPARNLVLCQPSKPYGAETVEGATLSSIANLERAYQHYQGVDGSSASFKRAALLMLPRFEDVVETVPLGTSRRRQVSSTKTDNAGFATLKTDDSVLPVYVVFPKSVELSKVDRWRDINLWEIPWVMAHEFGHQVFYTHYRAYDSDTRQSALSESGKDASWATLARDSRQESHENGAFDGNLDLDLGQIWNPTFPPKSSPLPSSTLSSEGQKHNANGGFALAEREINLDTALGALNEGFADLFGAYSVGESKTTVETLPCFAESRDLRSDEFHDGLPKVLNQDVLDEYFSNRLSNSPRNCSDTSFQDSHHIGAIVAHGVHRMISVALGEKATRLEKTAKLIAWIERFSLDRDQNSSVDARELFDIGIDAAIATMTTGLSDSGVSGVCNVARKVFPVRAKDFGTGSLASCSR